MKEYRLVWIPLTRIVKEIKPSKRKAFEDMISKQSQTFFGSGSQQDEFEDNDMPTDSMGRTVAYYRDLGVEPPEDLLEETKQALRGFSSAAEKFTDADFDLNERKIRVPEKTMDLLMESTNLFPNVKTLLQLTDGRVFFIKESILEIDKLIEVCQNT